MRQVFISSVMVVLAGAGLIFAQDSGPSAPAAPAKPAVAPQELPPRPVPIAVPVPPPPPPEKLPAPQPLLAPPGPPPEPPLSPPLFAEPALDGFASRYWLSADYLLWWFKDNPLPALVTSGSPDDAVPGALGQPGTQVLFGGHSDNPVRSGARFRGGYWFTRDQSFGIDGTFFFVGGRSDHFGAASAGVPLLTRPFLNVNTGQEDADLVAFPGRQAGAITAAVGSHLWGADTNLRGMLFRGASYQVSLLGGFRFLDLHEALRIKEMDDILPQSFGDDTVWVTRADHFGTSNQFYGGQIGTDVMWCRGRFYVDVLAKVALGVSVEHAAIDGWTAYSTSGGQSGGVGVGALALPSNSGTYGKDQFAVVPEAGINFGYALTQHIRLTFGYTFLYWSRVFRPGNQIDRAINPTEFPAVVGLGTSQGPPRPNFTFKDSDFWAQGLNFGLVFRY